MLLYYTIQLLQKGECGNFISKTMQSIKKKDKYIQQVKRTTKDIVGSLLLYGTIILFCILEGLGILDDTSTTTLHYLPTTFLIILIPIAVALFSKNEDIPGLDRALIAHRILHIKQMVVALILMIVPTLIWDYRFEFDGLFQVAVLLIYAVGVYFFFATFRDSYYWFIRNKRHDYRRFYLKKEKDLKKLRKYWQEIWEREYKNFKFETKEEFTKTFFDTIDDWLNKKDVNNSQLLTIIGDFVSFTQEKADNDNPVFINGHYPTPIQKFLQKLLEWSARREDRLILISGGGFGLLHSTNSIIDT